MMTKVSGICLRREMRPQGDAIVWLMTRERGELIVALPKHGKAKKSLFALSELFCYGDYVLNERHADAMPTVSEIDLREAFLPLRTDCTLLALGGYFCEVVREVATSEADETLLRLLLNALYALTVKTYDATLVKAVFEFRLAAHIGFMPDLVACEDCGKEGTAPYYLDVMNGHYLCEHCRKLRNELTDMGAGEHEDDARTRTLLEILPAPAMATLRYVLSAPLQKILSFRLEGDDLRFFVHAAEAYLLNHLERSFRSLEFYKQVT